MADYETAIIVNGSGPHSVAITKTAILEIPHLIELCNLKERYWFSNFKRNDSSTGIIGAGTMILADSWIGLSTEHAMNELGISSYSDFDELQILADIFTRTVRIAASTSQDLIQSTVKIHFGKRIRKDVFGMYPFSTFINYGLRAYTRRPSCNSKAEFNAQNDLAGDGLDSSRIHSCLYSKTTAIALFPRFAYARKLSDQPMPNWRSWKHIENPNRGKSITDALLNKLSSMQNPILLTGKFQPRYANKPQWLRIWLAGRSELFGRTCFTLQEIEQLTDYGSFFPETLLMGQGWIEKRSEWSFAAYLDSLVRIFKDEWLVERSWSAGLVAFNALVAAMPNLTNPYPVYSMQSAWLSMYDRLELLPAMQLLDRFKINIFFARSGNIAFKTPSDPKRLEELQREFWKLGLVLTHAHPSPDKDFKLSEFGGSLEEQSIAHAMHTNNQDWLVQVDSVFDQPPVKKQRMLNTLKNSIQLQEV